MLTTSCDENNWVGVHSSVSSLKKEQYSIFTGRLCKEYLRKSVFSTSDVVSSELKPHKQENE